MWIIVLIIIMVVIGMALAFPIAFLIVAKRGKAKKSANKILESSKLPELKELDRIMKILSTTPNDLEAADLWNRLQQLKTKSLPSA